LRALSGTRLEEGDVRPRDRPLCMGLTIEIHDAWLTRPEDLRKILTTLAGLECSPTGGGTRPRPAAPSAREDLEDPSDPEDRPRGRHGNGRYSGDDGSFQFSVLSFQQGRPIRRYGLKTEN
jgi:hypothetical protein